MYGYLHVTPTDEDIVNNKRSVAYHIFQQNKNIYNITDEQINLLSVMQFKDTRKFVFLDNVDMLFQYMGLLQGINFVNLYNETLSIINSKNVTSLHDIYYNLSIFNIPKRKVQIEIDNIRDVLEVEDGAYICSNCSSPKTFSSSKQMASADEASTIFVVCAACGHSWKTRG